MEHATRTGWRAGLKLIDTAGKSREASFHRRRFPPEPDDTYGQANCDHQ